MVVQKQETIDQQKIELIDLITKYAVIHGDIVLSSGIVAPYYIDLRRITLHHRGGRLVGKLMRDLLVDWDFSHVGGLTMGADPVATAIMYASENAVDAFVVRKSVKAHGLNRVIEGPDIAGRSVVIVEDSSTTGASALQAAHAAIDHGATVVGVATVVDRDTGARQRIQDAGFDYKYLLGLSDLGLAAQI